MAGKYIEFVNPGYSTLYTRDLKYAANTTRDAADPANPFNPDSANPLIEGEWLSLGDNLTCTRAGDATAGDTDLNVEVSPCMLHFSEKGRYDAQITKKAHLVSGPEGFEFSCKLGDFTGASAGDRVIIADFENPLASGKYVKALYGLGAWESAVAAASSSAYSSFAFSNAAGALASATHYFWSPGWIVRVVSNSEAIIMFAPSYVPAALS